MLKESSTGINNKDAAISVCTISTVGNPKWKSDESIRFSLEWLGRHNINTRLLGEVGAITTNSKGEGWQTSHRQLNKVSYLSR